MLASLGVVIPLAANLPADAVSRSTQLTQTNKRAEAGNGGLAALDKRFGAARYQPTPAQQQAVKALGKHVTVGWAKTGTGHSVVATGRRETPSTPRPCSATWTSRTT